MRCAAFSCLLICATLLAGCATPPVVATPPGEEVKPPPPVQAAEAVPAMLAPPSEEVRVIAAVNAEENVFFKRGEAEIDALGQRKLLLHAERLKADPRLHVTLVGSTDEQGSRSFNLAIAEKRVNAVYLRLRALGVRREQIRRVSMGGEKGSKSCRSETCHKLMRRVELRYQH